MCQHLINCNN